MKWGGGVLTRPAALPPCATGPTAATLPYGNPLSLPTARLLVVGLAWLEANRAARPQGRARSLVDEPKRGTASLRLWYCRREDNTGCKQSFAHLLPDDIADPGGINVPGQQLHRMGARPSSLLVGALAARLAAEGWRPPRRIDFEPLQTGQRTDRRRNRAADGAMGCASK